MVSVCQYVCKTQQLAACETLISVSYFYDIKYRYVKLIGIKIASFFVKALEESLFLPQDYLLIHSSRTLNMNG